jgi:hypothetical protein
MVELIGRDQELADLEESWARAKAGVPQLKAIHALQLHAA